MALGSLFYVLSVGVAAAHSGSAVLDTQPEVVEKVVPPVAAEVPSVSPHQAMFSQRLPSTAAAPSTKGRLGSSGGMALSPKRGFVRFVETVGSVTRTENGVPILQVPLQVPTVMALLLLVSLSFLGAVYLFKLATQRPCNCELCDGDIILDEKLGSGGFGDVFVCHREGCPAEQLVLKRVPVEDINEATCAQEEAKDMRMLNHKHIVGYVTDFLHKTTQSAGKDASLFVCIVMEHCSSDLRRLIEATRQRSMHIPEEVVVRFVVQICDALRFCHSKNIIHRDIKPQNIFLNADGDIRVGDFGLSRTVKRPFTNYTEAGTDCYKSPEALFGGRRDGRKADMWAVGQLVHELCTLKLAWEHDGGLGARLLAKKMVALDEHLALVPRGLYSPGLISLMRSLLAPEPKNRPSAEEVLRSKFIKHAVNQQDRRRRSQLRSTVNPHGKLARRASNLSSASAAPSSGHVAVFQTVMGWSGNPNAIKDDWLRQVFMPPSTTTSPMHSEPSSPHSDDDEEDPRVWAPSTSPLADFSLPESPPVSDTMLTTTSVALADDDDGEWVVAGVRNRHRGRHRKTEHKTRR